jgi:hypothetical protein
MMPLLHDPVVIFVKAASDDLTATLLAISEAGLQKSASQSPDAVGLAMYKVAAEHGFDLDDLIEKQADFELASHWLMGCELAKAAGLLTPGQAHAFEMEKAALVEQAARAGGAFMNAVKAVVNPVKSIAGKVRAGMQDYQLARAINKSEVNPAAVKAPTPTVAQGSTSRGLYQDNTNAAKAQAGRANENYFRGREASTPQHFNQLAHANDAARSHAQQTAGMNAVHVQNHDAAAAGVPHTMTPVQAPAGPSNMPHVPAMAPHQQPIGTQTPDAFSLARGRGTLLRHQAEAQRGPITAQQYAHANSASPRPTQGQAAMAMGGHDQAVADFHAQRAAKGFGKGAPVENGTPAGGPGHLTPEQQQAVRQLRIEQQGKYHPQPQQGPEPAPAPAQPQHQEIPLLQGHAAGNGAPTGPADSALANAPAPTNQLHQDWEAAKNWMRQPVHPNAGGITRGHAALALGTAGAGLGAGIVGSAVLAGNHAHRQQG